ncbi:MAG: AtpZ/AtpI family protein [Myxococcota bacterium]|nr:AtpZ/AtpI family protein [Myxococcota bacterium]
MPKPWKEIGRYGSAGIELVVTMLMMAGIGHWLDQRYWGGHGWGLGAGFLLGVAVGFRNLVRTASKMQTDIERAEAEDGQAGRWTIDESWLHEDRSEPGGERRPGSTPNQPPDGSA